MTRYSVQPRLWILSSGKKGAKISLKIFVKT